LNVIHLFITNAFFILFLLIAIVLGASVFSDWDR